MPAAQYAAWEQHLQRWPPGDPLTQKLLANLCSLVANAAFTSKTPFEPYDFAPWLRTPEDVERERRAARRQRAQLVATVYLRTRNAD